MMEIFEFIHLIEISRLAEIFDAQKFSGLWKPMYEPLIFHLSFDCSMLRKKTLQFLLRPMENVCLIRSLTCASLNIKCSKMWEFCHFLSWIIQKMTGGLGDSCIYKILFEYSVSLQEIGNYLKHLPHRIIIFDTYT